jgi:Ni,Fe-hydrogenase III small subunit
MKVHRIITTIEVENDNSITSVELINLHPTNADILLAITDITTNGNADDITKIYDSVNKSRLGIAGKLKGIARIINNSLDSHDYNVVADDNSTNEINDDLLL